MALSMLLPGCGGGGGSVAPQPPPIDELTITEAQNAFSAHQLTCHQLVQTYLKRIATNSGGANSINAILETNPDALAIADQLDQQYAVSGPVGPMHCVPTIVKDNWGTADRTHTTAASLTMNGFVAPADAFAIAKLRAAGAVLIAKANMDEWAKGLTGYSSRGGQTLNPYKLNRGPGGSTGGSAAAVSANLGMIGTATDTFGSIQVPSSFNGLAGIRPTVGLVGRTGIIPEALFSDTPGPLARTVTDVAIALGVMTGVDPGDTATNASVGKSYSNYTQFLDPAGLNGAHLGVLRSLAGVALSGDNSQVDLAIINAQQVMQGLGASITQGFDVPGDQGQLFHTVAILGESGFKADINNYLATTGAAAPVHSLADIVTASEAPGIEDKVLVLPELKIALNAPGLTDPDYLDAVQDATTLQQAVLQLMDNNGVDALIYATIGCPPPPLPNTAIDPGYSCGMAPQPLKFGQIPGSPAPVLSPLTGFPVIIVPAGFTADGLPIGLSILGRPWSEPTLFKFAYAFEQATQFRQAPSLLP